MNGVKEPSYFSLVPCYDIIRGTSVDYMHCVLLGVSRMLMFLWFDSKHHDELWYCGRKRVDVDKKLCSIQPPHCISRTPRSVDLRAYWKASEYRNWLLFYSLPVLLGILHSAYLEHHLLLVEGIYLLLLASISNALACEIAILVRGMHFYSIIIQANHHHHCHLLPGDLDHLTMKRYIRKICIIIMIIIINHCIPQANVQNVELVKGIGVMLPATTLASAIRREKRNPTLLLRKLIEEMFPPDILKYPLYEEEMDYLLWMEMLWKPYFVR